MKKYDFAPMITAIQNSNRILVVGHTSPDGDTTGSGLAMACILKALHKQVQVVFADDIPLSFHFLPGASEIIKPEAITDQPDLVILVDCATLDRTGDGWLNSYLKQAALGVIDHHALREELKAIEVIDPDVAATGELIYALALALQLEISVDLAVCIYTAIASDTGGFRFANTTKQSFAIGSVLVDIGVDMEQIRINLFETRSMPSMKVLGKALENMNQSGDKKIVWTFIEQADKISLGAVGGDCDNISGFTMFPADVRVGVFFQEVKDEGAVKISLRARRGYNVGSVAAGFGGGGHVLAAGCKIHDTLEIAMRQVLTAIRAMIEETEKP